MNNFIKAKQSASIRINQKIHELKKKGKKTTILSLGEAFFKLPDFGIKKVFSDGHHYSDSKGLVLLRKKLCQYYLKYGAKINYKNEIIISAGSKILTFMTFMLLLKKNDEVLALDPSWLSYEDQLKLIGAKIKYIPIFEQIKNFKKYKTNKTKLLILNNPNNPSGVFFDKNKLKEIYDFCKKNKIYILSDEAYSDFIPKNKKFFSMASFDKSKKNIIVVNSISKNFGMSGWRIGYVISNKYLMEQFLILNQQLITCAPTILQTYISRYFNKILNNNKSEIKRLLEKRIKVTNFLKKNNIEYLESDCTFYIFIKTGKNNTNFNKILIKKYGISVVPGKFYGSKSSLYVRISIGTENLNKIISALKIIRRNI